MRRLWEWWRGHCHDADQRPVDVEEAIRARHREEQALAAAEARRPEVVDLAARLRKHRQTNHFAELFMGGETH